MHNIKNIKHPIVEMDTEKNVMKSMTRNHMDMSDINQMGYFGNIWVRSHTFAKAGDTNGGGHKHNFDHVTLLAVGSVLVEVDGQETKEFHGPTFIVIDKNLRHKFTALTDGVVYYCVFAVRDLDGEVTTLYDDKNSLVPYFADMRKEERIIISKEI
jgi:hypothetical protein